MDGLGSIIFLVGAIVLVIAVAAGLAAYEKAKSYERLCEQESELRQEITKMRLKILEMQREIQNIKLGPNG